MYFSDIATACHACEHNNNINSNRAFNGEGRGRVTCVRDNVRDINYVHKGEIYIYIAPTMCI